jgi:hypothetical protein
VTRYSDETQLATVWIELLEFVRTKLRAIRTAGGLEGVTHADHIEIRKFPFVLPTDTATHKRGVFICPAPEQRADRMTTNVNQGLKIGVLVTAWSVSDGDLFADIGRILRWRGQMWKPQNGLNMSRYALASTSVVAEIEPGPVFDPGAWTEGIDQTTVLIRALTRAPMA